VSPERAGVMLKTAYELVVAVADNDVIGRANRLPWRLSADLQHFKALTLGKPVLMGRKTYESIGKALPGRTNLVLTRSTEFAAADCVRVASLDAAVAASAAAAPVAEPAATAECVIMVIGGAEIYRQCLPLARRIHLTLVHTQIADGDTFFSGWRGVEWAESDRQTQRADARNEFDYSFITLQRVTPVLLA
jgi:dihydrofolate reductase